MKKMCPFFAGHIFFLYPQKPAQQRAENKAQENKTPTNNNTLNPQKQ